MTETDLPLLSSAEMASFVARGFLRFDAVVPDVINDQFMKEAGRVRELKSGEKLVEGLRRGAGQEPHPRGAGRNAARRGLWAEERARAAAGAAAGARRASAASWAQARSSTTTSCT